MPEKDFTVWSLSEYKTTKEPKMGAKRCSNDLSKTDQIEWEAGCKNEKDGGAQHT